jgi:hypothetical protein
MVRCWPVAAHEVATGVAVVAVKCVVWLPTVTPFAVMRGRERLRPPQLRQLRLRLNHQCRSHPTTTTTTTIACLVMQAVVVVTAVAAQTQKSRTRTLMTLTVTPTVTLTVTGRIVTEKQVVLRMAARRVGTVALIQMFLWSLRPPRHTLMFRVTRAAAVVTAIDCHRNRRHPCPPLLSLCHRLPHQSPGPPARPFRRVSQQAATRNTLVQQRSLWQRLLLLSQSPHRRCPHPP